MPVPRGEEIATMLVARAEKAMVDSLNASAETILEISAQRAPKGDSIEHVLRAERAAGTPYPETQLFESGEVRPAAPGDLVAQVVYPGPYAAAQEVGEMTYESKSGGEVLWEATYYTTPATGPHYLEDATKIVMGELEGILAAQARIAFGG